MKGATPASLLVTMMGTSPVQAASSATTAPSAAAMVQVQKEAASVLQVTVQSANTMRDVQLTHLALPHGQPKSVKKLTDDAAALPAADGASWTKFVKTDATTKVIADRYAMINATVALSKDYVATPGKESAVKSADERLTKDDQRGAIDALRLAGIGMIENRCLMPLNQTRKAVAQAQRLLRARKYYGANLVLRGAEEDVVVDNKMSVTGS